MLEANRATKRFSY